MAAQIPQQAPPDEPEAELLDPRPCDIPEVEAAVLKEVLLLCPDVNKQWIRERAGHGTQLLVNFIFENLDEVPLEAAKRRLLNVSMNSNSSFKQFTEEDEIREMKIDALVVYIKQLEDPRERLPRDMNEYVKRRYPTIRVSVISQLKTLKNLKEVFAVCELISMKAMTRAVAQELHLAAILPRNGTTPWLDTPGSIKSRRKMAPLPEVPPYSAAHEDVRRILEAVGPNPAEVTCAVCYDDYSKKRSIACCEDEEEAHFVCHDCIRGQGRALCTDGKLAKGGQGFLCVDPDCKNVLPWANVQKMLDRDVRKVLSKRLDTEAVLGLEGLESCKFCSFQMLIDAPADELKVFSCQKCRAEFCRTCKYDWQDHAGRRCDEMQSVEDKKEAARRRRGGGWRRSWRWPC